jgi:CsoR family transcriptional regulator, copper-sensing transcriptional repressor
MRMIHSDSAHQRLLHRLKIIEGQIKTVVKMVDGDKYCVDVITQSKAIQRALREFDLVLLENHLRSCVIDLVKQEKSEKSVEEIMTLFRKQP